MLQSSCFPFSLVDSCVCFCACIPSYPTTLTSQCPCAVLVKQLKDQAICSQQQYDQVRMCVSERRKCESTTLHTRIPALYLQACIPLHACMPAFLHASLTTHFILSHCILAVFPCCFALILLWDSLDFLPICCLPQSVCSHCKQRRQQVLFVSSACSLC